MSTIIYREANAADILHLAEMRAGRSASKGYWAERINGYLQGLVNPRGALHPRVIYVAVDGMQVVGFVAGHLTIRENCKACYNTAVQVQDKKS